MKYITFSLLLLPLTTYSMELAKTAAQTTAQQIALYAVIKNKKNEILGKQQSFYHLNSDGTCSWQEVSALNQRDRSTPKSLVDEKRYIAQYATISCNAIKRDCRMRCDVLLDIQNVNIKENQALVLFEHRTVYTYFHNGKDMGSEKGISLPITCGSNIFTESIASDFNLEIGVIMQSQPEVE